MGNTFITDDIIAQQVLENLVNNCVSIKLVNTEYKKEFAKKGDTIRIKKPLNLQSFDGPVMGEQNVTEESINLIVNNHKHVPVTVSQVDRTLAVKKFDELVSKPAGIKLANDVDTAILNLYKDIHSTVGTAGTTPAAFSTLAAAARKLSENGAPPKEMKGMILDPTAHWSMADVLKGFFNEKMVSENVRKGMLGEIAGFDMYMDQNVAYHTAGTATSITVNGADQAGSTLSVSCTAGTFKKGDVITIAGCYQVNPVTKVSYSSTQQFTVTADSASATTHDLAIYPPIITEGANQTVSTSPDNGATVTLTASHKSNLAFHRNCLALCMIPIEEPEDAPYARRITDEKTGISILLTKSFDIKNFKSQMRFDILFAVKCIYPELGVRVLG